MVRLVFRPYAKVRRSICTSESRHASTRVSSGFALPWHRSPSFGSQRVRSDSVPPTKRRARVGVAREKEFPAITPAAKWSHSSRFHCAVVWLGYQAPRLAYRVDSLVRVSRRIGKEAVLLRRRHVAVRRQARRNPPHVPSPHAAVPNTRFRSVATQRRRDGSAEQRVCAFDSYFADG